MASEYSLLGHDNDPFIIMTTHTVYHYFFRILEGASNNLPDQAAESAAKDILKTVEDTNEEELVLVLISGGGSALLPCPVEGVTLDEKRQVTKMIKLIITEY